MLDVSIGWRVQWLADEQLAGRGKVVICGACKGSGMDWDDPSDSCPVCRGTGAVLRTDLRPDLPAPEPVTVDETLPVETTVRRWLRAFLD